MPASITYHRRRKAFSRSENVMPHRPRPLARRPWSHLSPVIRSRSRKAPPPVREAVTLSYRDGGQYQMYVSSMLRTGRKHWYWVLAGVVATVLLAVAAVKTVPADYSAKASVLLLPAKTPNGGDNPLLGIGGLQPTADTMARAMTDSMVAERLADAGATGTYEVILDPISKGPVLLITSEGKSPEEA